MKKILTALIFQFCVFHLFGQNLEGSVYVSNNPYGQGITLRWAGPEVIYRDGVNIYRKGNRGDWELLTPSPIVPPTSIPSDFDLGSNAQTLFETFLNEDPSSFRDGFSGVFTLLESVKNFPFALALNIAYNDESAQIGKKYQYKIEAIHKDAPVVLGITEMIKCEEFKPLLSPQGVDIKRKRKSILIKWENPLDKFYAYNLYLKKQEDTEYEIHSKELSSSVVAEFKKYFVNIPSHQDTVYYLKLEGLDYFGQKSEMSDEFVVQVEDFDPPVAPPLTVTVQSKSMVIKVAWKPGTEEDLSHYNLYRSHDEVDTVFKQINEKKLSQKDSLYIDEVEEHGTYSYMLEAVDKAGNNAYSIPYFGEVADVFPPAIPENLKARVDTGLFILSWDANDEEDLKGYEVLRSVADEDNSDNNFVPACAVIDTNYFEEPMAQNVRSPFVYVVRAVDRRLNRSQYSKEVIAQLPDVVAPVAPFIKETLESDNALLVKWMPNMEKDLKGYNLYKKVKDDTVGFQKVNIMLIPKSIKSYPDKEAERGVFYEYYLEAVDFSDLVSEKSNLILGKLNHLDMSGVVEITKSRFNKNKKEISLEWNVDKIINEPIAGMAVYRVHNGGKAFQRGKVLQDLKFKEKVSKPGTYQYHIRVYGERGNMILSESISFEVVKD